MKVQSERQIDPAWVLLVALCLTWVAALAGQHYGFARVFFERDAAFSDFILFVYGVPRSEEVYPLGFEAISHWYASKPGYRTGGFTIMHIPPFSMLLTVLAAKLFAIISPMLLFAVLSLTIVARLFATVRKYAPAPLAFVAVLSYPIAFMIDRGNLYAGLCGVCLVAALVRRKSDWTAAVLLAVALNIRPNVLPMVLPFVVLHCAIDWRFGLRVGLAALALGLASAVAAHWLYPAYTFSSWQQGMDLYLRGTLNDPVMLAFGSSLYSALYALSMPSLVAATVVAGTLAILGIAARFSGYLDGAEFTFICASVTALGSAVFVDYHLIVFIAPFLMARDQIALIASFLLLLPKGFGANGYATTQLIINPAIMLIASGAILCAAAARLTRPGTVRTLAP